MTAARDFDPDFEWDDFPPLCGICQSDNLVDTADDDGEGYDCLDCGFSQQCKPGG